jgi:hypothetical protein
VGVAHTRYAPTVTVAGPRPRCERGVAERPRRRSPCGSRTGWDFAHGGRHLGRWVGGGVVAWWRRWWHGQIVVAWSIMAAGGRGGEVERAAMSTWWAYLRSRAMAPTVARSRSVRRTAIPIAKFVPPHAATAMKLGRARDPSGSERLPRARGHAHTMAVEHWANCHFLNAAGPPRTFAPQWWRRFLHPRGSAEPCSSVGRHGSGV